MGYYIVDLKHRLMLAADPSGGGALRHAALAEDPCGQWDVVAIPGEDAFELRDLRFGRRICAPKEYDGKLYHREARDALEGRWRFYPMHNHPGGNLAVTIKDLRHGLAIVAADEPNGCVYHQVPAGRMNAFWTLVRV